MQELEIRIRELEAENIKLKNEVASLSDLVALLRRKQYGKSSEKVNHEQLGLFDEAELESLVDDPDDEIADDPKEIGPYKRRRGKRLKLPDHLPREEVIIDIEDKTCKLDGAELKYIGDDISEKLEIIPAKVKVIKTIRKKYACVKCETLNTGAAPLELLPKSNASASVLAYIATAKYVDALPLYRQEAIFKRHQINLNRTTMARWMIQIGEKVEPIVKLLREELLSSNYIHMDETTVQVLKEEGKKAQTKSYMWVQARSGPKPIILFHYAKNRSAEHPKILLDDYGGALQVDGYDGYAPVINDNRITRLGCFAHARRKFFEAFKSSSGKSIGKKGLWYITKLYELEDKIKDLDHHERFITRLKSSISLLREFKDWLEDQNKKVTPSSMSGKAIKYALNEWQYLMNCFCSGEYKIDNNYIESHIRPFTIGRKNWMFSVKPEGAEASANLYSLIETAKTNNLDPFEYLNKLFKKLPLAENEHDFVDLLPLA